MRRHTAGDHQRGRRPVRLLEGEGEFIGQQRPHAVPEQDVRQPFGPAGEGAFEPFREPCHRSLGGLGHPDLPAGQLDGDDLGARAEQTLPGPEDRASGAAMGDAEEPDLGTGGTRQGAREPRLFCCDTHRQAQAFASTVTGHVTRGDG